VETETGGPWIVLADGLGLGARIARRLAADRASVSVVAPGSPFAREDCLALLTSLGAFPAFVLHLRALAPEGGASPPHDLFARLEQGEEAGFRSLVPLLWALSGPGGQVQVVVAADRMQRVLRGEVVDPSRSSLPSLCETVTGAHPSLRCRTVDLRPPAPGAGLKAWIESTSKLLIAEVRHGREPAVAYRGGERWEPMADEAPQTDLERALAEVWRELLGGPPVRRRESFFERGGDSRSALLLAERLRQKLSIELPVAELLVAPTVAGLAEAIERRRWESLTPIPSPIARPALPGEGRPLPVPPFFSAACFPPLPVGGRAMGEGGQGGEARFRLDSNAWRRLKERGGQRAVTPAGLVLAGFCDVLATWSDRPRFAVAVDGAGLVEIDAAAPGGFAARAQAVQERLWKAVASRGAALAEWPVSFSFGSHPPEPVRTMRCSAQESDGGLTVRWGASEVMLGALRDHLLRLSAPGSEAAWSDERRRLIPPQQLARRIHSGGSDAPLPRERLEALVAARAEATPGRPAVVTAGRTLSYGELFELSGRLGRALRGLGVAAGTPVAVVQEPGWEAVVSILGILTAGAAWVPVEPRLAPLLFRKELAEYLSAAPGRPALAVTDRRLDGLAWPPEVHRIFLDELTADGGEPFRTPPSASDLACVIPLPGAGGPMIEHRGLANLVLDVNRIFGIGPDDRLLALSPLGSLSSLYEIFGPLAAGGCVVVPEAGAPSLETVHRQQVTVWVSEPAPLLRLMDAAVPSGDVLPFRLVLVSGRRLPSGLVERLRAACPGARLGRLTPVPEAPLWAAAAPLDSSPSFYGRPLANLTLHVLDGRLEPRPDGVAGALHLGGAGLARGTWRAPLTTESRFTIHPDTGERLFRTGETARVRPDGTVEITEIGAE
jgi:non-ribosomal peptide synthetase component F/acyl carrier protein